MEASILLSRILRLSTLAGFCLSPADPPMTDQDCGRARRNFAGISDAAARTPLLAIGAPCSAKQAAANLLINAASIPSKHQCRLVSDDGAGDVAIPAGDGAATVDIGKRLRAVRDPGPNPARSRDDLTSITGVFFDLLAGIHGRPLSRSPTGCSSGQAAQCQSLRR